MTNHFSNIDGATRDALYESVSPIDNGCSDELYYNCWGFVNFALNLRIISPTLSAMVNFVEDL
jgi:hypothetical protein